MVGPVPYVFLPGSARAALTFYRDVFGGSLTLHTYAELGRDDGPADAIAHGVLSGAVDLYAADVSGEQHPLRVEGLSFALLGAAPPRPCAAGSTTSRPGGL